MKILLIFFFITLSFCGHDKEEWKERAIYQLITDRFATSDGSEPQCDLKKYCGGTYRGLINHLDYIKGMGFNAIWISPIIKNFEGTIDGFQSYHGYHLIDLYSLNPHFGSEDDLKELISKCHEKDIWVMVDVVGNHVGPVGEDFSQINPFNSQEHYHERCQIIDWENQTQVENCRLSDLPDLNQDNEFVSNTLIEWIKDLVQKYDIDGIRIDTIPEVPQSFWEKFSKAAGVYTLGEVFNGRPWYVASYQKCVDGVFNYPFYYTIQDSFCGSMRNIESYIYNARTEFSDPSILGIFVENHDNPRFLNRCNDRYKFKNANILSIFWEGIPVFYYGGEQWFSGGADPNNREPLWGHYDTDSDMYKSLSIANNVRTEQKIWKFTQVQRYADDVFYSFTRGNVLVCVTRGEACQRTITYHEFSEGDKLCNALDPSDCVTVSGGSIFINMGQDPKIYVKQ